MSITAEELKSKIMKLYPEIDKNDINLSLYFDQTQDAWMATFQKNEHKLTTHLEEEDVEHCLQGQECYHLGIQLGQFIRNYCEGHKECTS